MTRRTSHSRNPARGHLWHRWRRKIAELLAGTGFPKRWARSPGHSPPAQPATPTTEPDPIPAEGTGTEPVARSAEPGPGAAGESPEPEEHTLWRMRTTVDDVPGSLAALCGAMAALRADILTLQTHPLSEGTVDEFLLRTPARLDPQELTGTVAAAGGRDTWIERADTHDLVDMPTRMLTLATRTALDAAELPLALRQLFGRCTIRSQPADRVDAHEDSLDGSTMRLRDPSGGSITVTRPHLPFTPTEFARARALVELDARLGLRVPTARDVHTLPAGNEITIRRAGPEDLKAALAMHERCSPATLKRRYHGPVKDADRYLTHLLSPRFGQTLAVETPTKRIVALAHLLWDGDETEVALLVEDAWQRRGIGVELLRRLVTMAAEADCESVYAITQSDNTAMAAVMRRLGLPLDYQVEEGTMVITARLAAVDDLFSATAPH